MNKTNYSIYLIVFLLLVLSPADFTANKSGSDWKTVTLDNSYWNIERGFSSPDTKTNGIFISDTSSSSVVVFDSQGDVVDSFGRKGRGPGDFEVPMSTVRANNGSIYVAELNGRISEFDGESGEFNEVLLFDFIQINKIMEFKDKYLIVNGSRRGQLTDDLYGKLLHVVDLEKKEVTHSFFPEPEHDSHLRPLIRSFSMNSVSFDISDDKIMVMYSMLPDIHVFDSNFNLTETLSIDFPDFVSVNSLSVDDVSDFYSNFPYFTQVQNLVMIDDTQFLIQLSSINDPGFFSLNRNINQSQNQEGGNQGVTFTTYKFDAQTKTLDNLDISEILRFRNPVNSKVYFMTERGSNLFIYKHTNNF